jgi:hypothetical protein
LGRDYQRDYGIKSERKRGYNYISLEKNWKNAMPIDLIVEYTDGTGEFLCSLAYDEFSKKTRIHQ